MNSMFSTRDGEGRRSEHSVTPSAVKQAAFDAAVRDSAPSSDTTREELAKVLVGDAFYYEPQRTLALMQADAVLARFAVTPKEETTTKG